jgi:predicted CoA-binding protein
MANPVIMAIDDDGAVLNAIERDLRSKFGRDYRVVKANSGMTALDFLKQVQARNEAIALFLTDQRMPQMTGIQFLEKAREVFPEAKRVLLTAYADTEVAIASINNDNELKQILKTIQTVASVGVSSSEEKPSYWIVNYLMEHGYQMIPVNPTASEILGVKAYPDLASIPQKIDVVQVFRKPEDVPPVVEQAIQIGAKIVWMQKGIANEDAARRAEAAGLKVVMNRCMMETHERLLNGFHR